MIDPPLDDRDAVPLTKIIATLGPVSSSPDKIE